MVSVEAGVLLAYVVLTVGLGGLGMLPQRTLAVITAVVVAIAPFDQAPAQVGGVIAFVGLAQSILTLGSKGSDVTETAILAEQKVLEALVGQIDAMQNAVALIASEIKDLPKEMREEVDQAFEEQDSENVLGLTQSLRDMLLDIHGAKGQSKESYIQQARNSVTNLYAEANTLSFRSDFVLPAYVSAMVTEVNTILAIEDKSDATNDVNIKLKEFDARIAKMQDASQPNSLANLTEKLQQALNSEETQIAKTVIGSNATASQLTPRTYAWFSGTQQIVKQIAVPTTCSLGQGGPGGPPGLRMGTCYPQQTVSVDDHTRSWQRIIVTLPLNDGNAAGLFLIKIVPAGPTTTPGYVVGATRHTNSDGAFEKPFFSQRKEIQTSDSLNGQFLTSPGTPNWASYLCPSDTQAAVDEFNQITQALLDLRRLDALASAARMVAVRWNSDEANTLLMEADQLSGQAQKDLNLLAQMQRDQVTTEAIKAMDESQRKAWEAIEDEYKEVTAAINQAKSQKWRTQVNEALGILKGSLALYEAADKYDTAHKLSPGAAKLASADAAPQDEADAEARVARVQQIIKDVTAFPASSWQWLPPDITGQEVELMEATAHLDTLEPTRLDQISQRSGPDELSEPSRNELRKNINDLFVGYAVKRIGQSGTGP
jgi:hypothetical protein